MSQPSESDVAAMMEIVKTEMKRRLHQFVGHRALLSPIDQQALDRLREDANELLGDRMTVDEIGIEDPNTIYIRFTHHPSFIDVRIEE